MCGVVIGTVIGTVVSVVASIAGAAVTTAAAKDALNESKYNNEIAKFNARNIENEAQRSRNEGTDAENAHREKVNQLISLQRATFAAGNVDINSGTPLGLQIDTRTYGDADALRIRDSVDSNYDAQIDQADLVKREGEYGVRVAEANYKNSMISGVIGVHGAIGSAIGGLAAQSPAPTATATPVANSWYKQGSALFSSKANTAFTSQLPSYSFGP